MQLTCFITQNLTSVQIEDHFELLFRQTHILKMSKINLNKNTFEEYSKWGTKGTQLGLSDKTRGTI